MKKWTYALLILFIGQVCYAQTHEEKEKIKKATNAKELDAISEKFLKERRQMLNKLRSSGKIKNSGNPKEDERNIMDVDSVGNPIYFSPLDSDGTLAIKANSMYTGGSLGLSVHGEGMTAGMWDEGSVRTTHIALENRAINLETWALSGHSTAVAGQIAATDAYSPTASFGKAVGIAMKANVRAYQWTDDVTELTQEVKNGLLVSNHSYPATYGSLYSQTSAYFDNIVYHGPYFTCVRAAGNINDPTGTHQLSYAATGKNTLVVGSIAPLTNYTNPADVVRASASSKGPTDDGRIKPDIVANGWRVAVINSSSDNGFLTGGTGASGTSYASPQVAGAVLLLQQHYNNLNANFMRGATVKGLMLHTANEAGLYDGPDITFGWGLLNVERAATVISNNGGKSAILQDSLLNGTTFSRDLVASGTEPLVATICWTDTAGTPEIYNNITTIKLVNDLDLRLSDAGNTYFPWKLDSTNYDNPALKGDNIRDNVEKVEIKNPVPGQTYTLTVSHKSTLYKNGQHFSVIISGLEECVANRTILSSVNYPSLDQQQASASITARNVVSTGAQAIYHAADEVMLKDGFTGLAGSEVRAYLEGCTNDYNARTAAIERAVVTYPTAPSSVEKAELPENAVYPNPGNGLFRVRLDGIASGKVEVVAGDGKAVFGKSFKDQPEMEVDIKNSTPGIYILRVVSEQKVLTRKIVKK
ncbi:Por secretion system C-terminal sorting domain-containing protein [Dyadobacter sp. SG02]|uniref:S8 family peptidase n=1 Tax=Dyadobacter sp. SG02 TaxID=1855291 RepID=UPI0008CAB84A|nr:S8 family peptidase [Dyadobacter sp. SG02]SEJ02718.1 Por secretion system C-terminal sorting domain-containing protein [Dyadobacter sp. SG02]